MKKALLEHIAQYCNCDYLSDLRNRNVRIPVAVVEEMKPEDYPLREWEDAFQYLIGLEHHFENCQQAKQELLTQLKTRSRSRRSPFSQTLNLFID